MYLIGYIYLSVKDASDVTEFLTMGSSPCCFSKFEGVLFLSPRDER